MIKTILFDLNKVLVTYETTDFNSEYMKLTGLSQSEFWKGAWEFLFPYMEGRMNLSEVLTKTLEKHDLGIELLENMLDLHEESFSMVEDIRDILDKLKPNYNLILLAGDGEESLNFKLDNFDLRKYFTKVYATCDMGILKNRPEYYERVLAEENLNPEECLFVDDHENHIAIARKLGINSIHFKNSTQLKEELVKYNLSGFLLS
jgi:HAD superfamily hydrolase (TIGR01509 family)